MEATQIILLVALALSLGLLWYFLRRAILKIGEPYDALREEMEDIRIELSAKIKSGTCTKETISSLVARFNKNARKLRMPEFERES